MTGKNVACDGTVTSSVVLPAVNENCAWLAEFDPDRFDLVFDGMMPRDDNESTVAV